MTQETLINNSDTPVTVSIARRAKAGKEKLYEDWLHSISEVATKFPGHQGVHVLKPSAKTGGEYVLIVGFSSYAHQKEWEESDVRQRFLNELDEKDLIEGPADIKKVSGLEFWFTLPEVPASARPNQHKMALVLLVVVFFIIYMTNVLVGPWLSTLEPVLRIALIVFVQVLLMTYVVMPNVTRLLKTWLFK